MLQTRPIKIHAKQFSVPDRPHLKDCREGDSLHNTQTRVACELGDHRASKNNLRQGEFCAIPNAASGGPAQSHECEGSGCTASCPSCSLCSSEQQRQKTLNSEEATELQQTGLALPGSEKAIFRTVQLILNSAHMYSVGCEYKSKL